MNTTCRICGRKLGTSVCLDPAQSTEASPRYLHSWCVPEARASMPDQQKQLQEAAPHLILACAMALRLIREAVPPSHPGQQLIVQALINAMDKAFGEEP